MTKEQKFREWWDKQGLGHFNYADTAHFNLRVAFYAGMEANASCTPRRSEPLTLGELKNGDYFITFPQDGDDEGHGGYRSGAFLMRKCTRNDDGVCGYWRLTDLMRSSAPISMQVLKVIK